MLPKLYRLKKNKDIKRVSRRGRRFKENFLILKTISNNLKQTRFSFIVSQKFSKRATLRNKIRRKLRELAKLRLKEMKKGKDVIVIAGSGLETKDFWEIKESINKLFKKAGLINKRVRKARNQKTREIK